MLTVILLLQVATATPRPTVVLPGPAATPRLVQANEGLAGTAGKIKIKKVDFSDVKTTSPALDHVKPRTEPSCMARDFAMKMDGIVQKFAGIESVASTTARIALGGPLTEMAKVRSEMAQLAGPSCSDFAKNAALLYMDTAVMELQAFQMKEPYNGRPRRRALDAYNAELNVLLIGQ